MSKHKSVIKTFYVLTETYVIFEIFVWFGRIRVKKTRYNTFYIGFFIYFFFFNVYYTNSKSFVSALHLSYTYELQCFQRNISASFVVFFLFPKIHSIHNYVHTLFGIGRVEIIFLFFFFFIIVLQNASISQTSRTLADGNPDRIFCADSEN